MNTQILYSIGTALIVAGIVLLIIAVVYMSVRKGRSGQAKAAGIIMIGPIPIIFGTDKKSVKTVIVLAIALTVMLVIALVVYYFLLR